MLLLFNVGVMCDVAHIDFAKVGFGLVFVAFCLGGIDGNNADKTVLILEAALGEDVGAVGGCVVSVEDVGSGFATATATDTGVWV